MIEIVGWVDDLLLTRTYPVCPFLPRRGSSLLVICGSLLVYGPGVVKHSVGGYTGLVVPIGFGYVLGRWYLLLEIRYQQKGSPSGMDVVGHHLDDVLCWVNLRPFGILHVPLLIFPRVVLGGGCGFLERDATSLYN